MNETGYPRVATREEWLAERKRLLAKEKGLTALRDKVNADRRRLPMVKVDRDYVFEGPNGEVSLLDLFEGRSQLVVYHFMFDPTDGPEGKGGEPFSEGCSGCSFTADNVPHLSHFHARDTTFAMVSRAQHEKIAPFQRRMGWAFPWYSSFGSAFNYDFHATTDEAVAPVEYNYKDRETLEREGHTYHLHGEQPGLSVFLRVGEEIYHTYSAYGRGLDQLIGTYVYLDLTPYGRQEEWEDSPQGWPQTSMFWVRHHDKYGDASPSTCCGVKGD